MTGISIFPDLFVEYSTKSGRIRTEASKGAYRSTLQSLQWQHPKLRTDQVTAQHLTEFCLNGKDGYTLAPATIKTRRAILRSVFEWAEYAGHCPTNPASTLKYTVTHASYKVRPGSWLDEQQFAELLRACPNDLLGRRDRLMLMVGFMMGVRRAALANLRWDQFSPDLRVLSITVKGNKMTQKGVPPQLQQALQEWRQEAPADAVGVFPRLKFAGIHEPIEIIDWSKPLGHRGVSQSIQRAGARCGLKITPHDMRRSFAGILETKGVKVEDIQRGLDHTSIGTTSIYLDQNPSRSIRATGGTHFDI